MNHPRPDGRTSWLELADDFPDVQLVSVRMDRSFGPSRQGVVVAGVPHDKRDVPLKTITDALWTAGARSGLLDHAPALRADNETFELLVEDAFADLARATSAALKSDGDGIREAGRRLRANLERVYRLGFQSGASRGPR